MVEGFHAQRASGYDAVEVGPYTFGHPVFRARLPMRRPRVARPTPWAWTCWGFTGSSRAPRSCTSTIPIHPAEGGALTCNDKNLKERIDLLKNFGTKDEVVMPGINGKMSELQAALGLGVLDYIEEERARRMS